MIKRELQSTIIDMAKKMPIIYVFTSKLLKHVFKKMYSDMNMCDTYHGYVKYHIMVILLLLKPTSYFILKLY